MNVRIIEDEVINAKSTTNTIVRKGYSPYIGENGNWFEFDVQTQAFVDTGIPSNIKGDKGDQGEQGVQGIQGVQGMRGERGEKGERGEQGIQGERGEKGDSYDDTEIKAELNDVKENLREIKPEWTTFVDYDLIPISSSNILDPSTIVDGYWARSGNTMTLTPNSAFQSCVFNMSAFRGGKLYFTAFVNNIYRPTTTVRVVGIKRGDGSVVDYFNQYTATPYEIDVPSDGGELYLSWTKGSLVQIESGSASGVYEEYIEPTYKIGNYRLSEEIEVSSVNNFLKGKKLSVIGDSMVEGHTLGKSVTWCNLIANRNGMEIQNLGKNGCTLISDGTSHSANPVIDRYGDIDAKADIIVVFVGTNDAREIANGTLNLGTNTDKVKTTFYGALNLLCEALQTAHPKAKLLFITPYDRTPFIQPSVPHYDAYPLVIDAIKEICKKNNIKVWDNNEYGQINWRNSAMRTALTLGDGYHLNIDGHLYVSYGYEACIKGL